MAPLPGWGPPPGPPSWGSPPGQPAPPTAWGPPPNQPAQPTITAEPSPASEPEAPPGVTASGLPITRRGHVALDLSAMEITAGSGFAGPSALFVAGAAIDARARLKGALYANARFATGGFALPGNLMGGADYTITAAPKTWVTLGGALGVPLSQRGSSGTFGLPFYSHSNAGWNRHEYIANVVPLRLDGAFEMVRGDVGVRVEIQPVFMFPFDQQGADVEVLFQHAAEVQYGHSLGAGLRIQGVANSFGTGDDYQGAFEPFVFVRREMGYARLGLIKTLDEESPVYNEAWGMRLSAGFHLD